MTEVDAEADDEVDGTPQPASARMDKATATWYVQHTRGQFQCYLAADGYWYLYVPKDQPINWRDPAQ